MLFYHCLYIEKPQPVAFGIVDISCRNPVEFIENVRLFIRRDANAMVCNRDFHLFRFLFSATDRYVGFIRRIFDGIIYQVTQNITEVCTVGNDCQVFRCNVCLLYTSDAADEL